MVGAVALVLARPATKLRVGRDHGGIPPPRLFQGRAKRREPVADLPQQVRVNIELVLVRIEAGERQANRGDARRIGTDGGGLSFWNRPQNRFTNYRHQPGITSALSNNLINSICGDREGNIWLATFGGGINRFNRATNSFQHYSCVSATGEENKNIWRLLVDRSGQLVTVVGETLNFDPLTFATLTAADFSANAQLARLIGETDFTTLFHQGERESMYVADVARRLILVVLFDNRTPIGLVRLKMKPAVEELTGHLDRAFARARAGGTMQPNILAGAGEEIDELFNW